MAGRVVEPDIERYYTAHYREADRLSASAAGRAEFARTVELLSRILPPSPAIILDVGGGPGAYAHWLTRAGYTVQLVDLVPAHVRAALTMGGTAAGAVADARRLPAADRVADAVLLLGPLYHLTGRADRLAALREAARATRPGGVVAAAAISRNAPLMDLTWQGRVDAATRPRILAAYASGVNDPATGFTTAYFHRPEELAAEFRAAGLPEAQVMGIEGPLWPLLNELDPRPDDPLFAGALDCARIFEDDPAVLGASAHLLASATVGQ